MFLLTACKDDAHFCHFVRRRHCSNIILTPDISLNSWQPGFYVLDSQLILNPLEITGRRSPLTEHVTVTPRKVMAGWKGVWTSESFHKRCWSSHPHTASRCSLPHLLQTPQRKGEDAAIYTQGAALPGHPENFLSVPWRWGFSCMESDPYFMCLRRKA